VTLAANVILLTALLSLLGAALTLPGIAAVVLTVGMAVDANILIYERIREELRIGVSPRAAITAGFDRAFSAIADSNVTAFIAGLVLWLFGAGAVRGFAVVLMLGIDLDVHRRDGQPRAGADHLRRKTQGRAFVDLSDPRLAMEFFHKVTRFPFMNTRKVWYGLSAAFDRGVHAAGAAARTESWRGFHRRRGRGDQFPPGAEHRNVARRIGESRGDECPGPGLRQFARHPGAPAAGPERQGRSDRCAYPGGIRQPSIRA
jgi:hypothetical protein